MNIRKHIQNLEKRKIISKKPNPVIPFILAAIILILYKKAWAINQTLANAVLSLFALTIIFAVAHLIVYKILTSK